MRNFQIAKKKLDAIAKKIGNRKIYYLVFSRMLNKEFESLRVRFKFQSGKEIASSDYMVVSGNYNHPEYEDDFRYSIYISKHPDVSYIKPRRHFYSELYYTLVHEFRHGYQYRRRNFRKRREPIKYLKFKNERMNLLLTESITEINYLIDYDEIDAYAAEAAIHKDYSRYDVVKEWSPKHWKKFMKKVYLFSNK